MEMIIDPAEMVQTYIILEEPVLADAPIRELDIYLYDPIELEMMHRGLCFLTSVKTDTRDAKNGRWKRLRGEDPLHSRDGSTIGVTWSYKFGWTHLDKNGVARTEKPGFRMKEYRINTDQSRTVVVITRTPDKKGSGKRRAKKAKLST